VHTAGILTPFAVQQPMQKRKRRLKSLPLQKNVEPY